jgi:hypothetical protein
LSRWPGVVGLAGLALLLLIQGGLAQTLRVTTWSLQAPAAGTNTAAANTNGIRIPAAAAALRKLNPDVILLQQVTDWAMCDELAEALKPAKYSVVTCSAFRDMRGALRPQQIAILAKASAKPYFSWSDAWRNRGIQPLPGGFAFAALQIGQQRVGLFSVQAAGAGGGQGWKQKAPPTKQVNPGTPQERMAVTIERLLAQVGSVSSWVTNRLQGIIVGGTFGLAAGQDMALHDEPLQLLHDAGFSDAFEDAPAAARTTVRGRKGPVADYLFTQPANCTTNPTVLRAQVSRRFPVTCDVQLGVLTAALPPLKVPVALPTPTNAANARAETPTLPVAMTAAAPVVAVSVPVPTNAPKLQVTAPAPAQPSKLNAPVLWITSAGVGLPVLGAFVVLLAWRRKPRLPRRPALITDGADAPSAYTVVMGTRSGSESSSPSPRPAPAPAPVIRMESPGMTHTEAEALRRRTLAAELEAERAKALVRANLLPDLRNWLKQKLARKLMSDRARLLQTQQTATRQAADVEHRLARVEQQIHQQNRAYVDRIEQLTRELLSAKEENRELIRARIAQVKAEMAAARERLLAQE